MSSVSFKEVGKSVRTARAFVGGPRHRRLRLLRVVGCGKSTLPRMLAGLEATTWDEVVADALVDDVGLRDRDIAIIIHDQTETMHVFDRATGEAR
jgi:ABC-type sugar transport system ATPase subunit